MFTFVTGKKRTVLGPKRTRTPDGRDRWVRRSVPGRRTQTQSLDGGGTGEGHEGCRGGWGRWSDRGDTGGVVGVGVPPDPRWRERGVDSRLGAGVRTKGSPTDTETGRRYGPGPTETGVTTDPSVMAVPGYRCGRVDSVRVLSHTVSPARVERGFPRSVAPVCPWVPRGGTRKARRKRGATTGHLSEGK